MTIDPQQGGPENPYAAPTPGQPAYPQAPAYPQVPTYPGQPGYAPGYGAAPAWGAPLPPLASWAERVGASLIDSLVCSIPLMIGYGIAFATADWSAATSDGTGTTAFSAAGALAFALGWLVYAGIYVWNRVLRQGKTGQSLGKKLAGIRLVSEDRLQPIGPGMAFVRDIVHIVDSFAYVGYLWPLWDVKRQTFADKILRTLVVKG